MVITKNVALATSISKVKSSQSLLIKLACSLFALTTSNVLAAPLSTDSGWSVFTFGGVESGWSDTYQFSSSDQTLLTVTDAYFAGDQFEVFANGSSLGITSAPGFDTDANDKFDLAAANSIWSTGEFVLDAGDYNISGTTTMSPYGSGGGAIKIDTYVIAEVSASIENPPSPQNPTPTTQQPFDSSEPPQTEPKTASIIAKNPDGTGSNPTTPTITAETTSITPAVGLINPHTADIYGDAISVSAPGAGSLLALGLLTLLARRSQKQ